MFNVIFQFSSLSVWLIFLYRSFQLLEYLKHIAYMSMGCPPVLLTDTVFVIQTQLKTMSSLWVLHVYKLY